jgi:YgiT-type zinc finger domain-containing protein
MGVSISEKPVIMKCIICKLEYIQPETAVVTLTRETLTLVVRDVPAQVCENCGEEYVDEVTTARLLQVAEEAARAGVQVDVRQYVAARS